MPGAPSSFSRKHATSLTWGGQEPGLRPRVWGARCSDSQREAAWPPHLSSSRLQHGNGLVAHRASRAGGCRAGVPCRRGAAGRGAWRAPPTPRRRRRTPQQVVVLPSRSDFAFAPERERRSGKRVSVAAAHTSCPRPRAQGRLPLLPESRGRRSRRLSSSPLGETALRPSYAEQRVQVRSGKQLGISGDQHSGNDGPCPL